MGRLKIITILLLASLAIMPLALRTPIALERKVLPAGDAFNFQSITESLSRFSYPRLENRLPGFPVLILLTRPFPVDPISAATAISILTSALLLPTLYLLGRALSLHPVPLLGALGLLIFHPVITVVSVRPLSDSTFLLFLILYLLLLTKQLSNRQPPKVKYLLVIGLVTSAMIFTRYEGLAIAAATLPLLKLTISWRKLGIAIAIPLVLGFAWLPVYHYVHGSFAGGYIEAFREPETSRGSKQLLLSNFTTLMKGAGWARAWTISEYEVEQEPTADAIIRVGLSPAWWISILALIGIPWLLIKTGRLALPIVIAVSAYIGVLIWWFVYSRFVTPLLPVFFISVAAGGSFLIYALRRWRNTATVLVGFLFIWFLWSEAPGMYKVGLGRAWENNQQGYALFTAVRETAKDNQLTAYWTDEQVMAKVYFKDRGIYFNTLTQKNPSELAEYLQAQKVRHLIISGRDDRLLDVRSLLQESGAVESTTTYRSFIQSTKDEETVEVDHLRWP